MACIISKTSCSLSQASKIRALCNIAINDTYAKIILTSIETLAVISFFEPSCFGTVERSLKQLTDSHHELNMIKEKIDNNLIAYLTKEGLVEFNTGQKVQIPKEETRPQQKTPS